MSAIVATGCGAVNAAKRAVHDVEGNKATIDTFTDKVKAGEASAFEATYVTTGSTPATIVYAVRPPTGLAFTETPSAGAGAGAVDIVVNPSGEFSCSAPPAGSSTWSCQRLAAANASTENQIFGFYTPAHWITFLRDFSLAAGLAGDKVTSSTMTVNGFNLQCVDVRGRRGPGNQHDLLDRSGHPRLCQGGDRRHEFRDQELFGIATIVIVRDATGRDHHHVGTDDGPVAST